MQMTRRISLLAALFAATLCSSPNRVTAADDDPVVTEYDVVPDWPKRPENISGTGWVSGMAIDGEDNIWFFRKGPDPVQVYKPDGEFVRSWGKGMFVQPHHLRIDHEGNVWLADFGQHIVQKFTPEGKLLMTLGVPNEKGEDDRHFNMPTDMVVTKSGDIFVTDGYGNRRIVHFTSDGNFVKTFGQAGPNPGEFVLPHAIVADSKGTLYVADRNSGRIQLFGQDGTFIEQWSNVLMPWGLTVTPDDEIWVCGSSPHWWYRHGVYPEYKDQLFVRFNPKGQVSQLWTMPLGDIGKDKDHPDTSKLKPGETVGAHCLARDSKGNIYVGDIYGERAQKFVPINKRGPSEKVDGKGDRL